MHGFLNTNMSLMNYIYIYMTYIPISHRLLCSYEKFSPMDSIQYMALPVTFIFKQCFGSGSDGIHFLPDPGFDLFFNTSNDQRIEKNTKMNFV